MSPFLDAIAVTSQSQSEMFSAIASIELWELVIWRASINVLSDIALKNWRGVGILILDREPSVLIKP